VGIPKAFDTISLLKATKTESWKQIQMAGYWFIWGIRKPVIPLHLSSFGEFSCCREQVHLIPANYSICFAAPSFLSSFVPLPQGFRGVTALSKSAVAKTSAWLENGERILGYGELPPRMANILHSTCNSVKTVVLWQLV